VPTEKWISVADYGDRISAEAIVGLLGHAAIACRIISNEHIPGLGSVFSVRVPPHLAERARSVLSDNQVTDAELTDLAMREPRDESSRE
jgi:hypothetical protein